MADRPAAATAAQTVQVFAAEDLYVATGANAGDALSSPAAPCLGDVYELEPDAAAQRLVLARQGGGLAVAPGSEVGATGDEVVALATLTLMGPDGGRVDLTTLRVGGGLFALPLSPLAPRTDYTLIALAAAPSAADLAGLLTVSFARGTRITLASGAQTPIETLRPGDRVLTRDHGPQPLVWAGRTTLRAVGVFAPVVITAGAMGNAGDLIVSQHHRMFIYQRGPRTGPTAELLVQAKHLADGDRIFVREGGMVDWFSLVFDRHEIIYAEGVPCESLLVTEATLRQLPPELAAEVRARFPQLSQRQHFGTEAGREAAAGLAGGGLRKS
jgi:hypothetical protein